MDSRNGEFTPVVWISELTVRDLDITDGSDTLFAAPNSRLIPSMAWEKREE